MRCRTARHTQKMIDRILAVWSHAQIHYIYLVLRK
jgi:hypothetical protein